MSSSSLEDSAPPMAFMGQGEGDGLGPMLPSPLHSCSGLISLLTPFFPLVFGEKRKKKLT